MVVARMISGAVVAAGVVAGVVVASAAKAALEGVRTAATEIRIEVKDFMVLCSLERDGKIEIEAIFALSEIIVFTDSPSERRVESGGFRDRVGHADECRLGFAGVADDGVTLGVVKADISGDLFDCRRG